MKKVLITGATGFVGSHTAKAFKRSGYFVIGLDREITIPESTRYLDHFVKDDYGSLVAYVAKNEDVDAIIHIAATSLVGPSIANPAEYYDNNVSKTNEMLLQLNSVGWNKTIIFSSSASVYGNNDKKYDQPLIETDEKNPVSPYGRSKMMCEFILQDHCYAYGFKGIALRYFNACGCDSDGDLGNTKNDSHLIPQIIRSLILGKTFTVFGTDFNTPDGSCLRDYLHVSDIANAHLEAVSLAETFDTGEYDVYNLGTSRAYTNFEIVRAVERFTALKVKLHKGPRREGDPDARVADATKFMHDTTWIPVNSSLERIVTTTYEWMKKLNYTIND